MTIKSTIIPQGFLRHLKKKEQEHSVSLQLTYYTKPKTSLKKKKILKKNTRNVDQVISF